jgi:hypothetical protein
MVKRIRYGLSRFLEGLLHLVPSPRDRSRNPSKLDNGAASSYPRRLPRAVGANLGQQPIHPTVAARRSYASRIPPHEIMFSLWAISVL